MESSDNYNSLIPWHGSSNASSDVQIVEGYTSVSSTGMDIEPSASNANGALVPTNSNRAPIMMHRFYVPPPVSIDPNRPRIRYVRSARGRTDVQYTPLNDPTQAEEHDWGTAAQVADGMVNHYDQTAIMLQHADAWYDKEVALQIFGLMYKRLSTAKRKMGLI